MATVEDRLAALEAENRSLRDAQAVTAQNLRLLSDEAVRARRGRDAASYGDLVGRLDPGPLSRIQRYRRGAPSRIPDLGAPLLARLRDDAMLSGVTAGRSDPLSGTGNLLTDPTFVDLPTTSYTLTTSRAKPTSSFGYWRAWYVLNSGTAPTTRTLDRIGDRWETEYSYGSAAVASWDLQFGANAADITVYLESAAAHGFLFSGTTLPSYLVSHVRLWVEALTGTAITTLDAYVEVVEYDSVGPTWTVVAQSDSIDLLALEANEEQALISAAYDTVETATTYLWRLRFDIIKDASGTATVQLSATEPDLHASGDGSPAMYTPAIGSWIPEKVTGLAESGTTYDVVSGHEDGVQTFGIDSAGAYGWYDSVGTLECSLSRDSANVVILSDANLIIERSLRIPTAISPTPGASVDDWGPTNHGIAGVFRIDPSANINITGLSGGAAGRIILLYNIATAFTITLMHNDAASTAANRFTCKGGADLVVGDREGVLLWYDGTSERWRPLAL